MINGLIVSIVTKSTCTCAVCCGPKFGGHYCYIIACSTHRPLLVHYGILVQEGNIVTAKGGITHEPTVNALYTRPNSM